MVDTPHLKMPLIAASQSQKHVTHNEALVLLDAVVQLSVISTALTEPPSNPVEGQRYVPASGATDAWSTWDFNIAHFTDGQWKKIVPGIGWLLFNQANGLVYFWTGAAWQSLAAAGGLATIAGIGDGSIAKVGVNTAADNTNRLAVKSDAVLFSHDDVTPGSGNLLFVLNKANAAADAGFFFQDNFSTRALIGLLGDDNFAFKVTPDGVVFHTAFTLNKDNGAVDHIEGSKFSSYVNFDKYIAAGAWTDTGFNNARHNDQGDWAAGTFTAPTAGYYLFGVGYRFKANAAVPTRIDVGLGIDGADPLPDHMASQGDAAVISLESFVSVTSLLKLSAGQTVAGMAFMATNDGYVEANQNHFWGVRIA